MPPAALPGPLQQDAGPADTLGTTPMAALIDQAREEMSLASPGERQGSALATVATDLGEDGFAQALANAKTATLKRRRVMADAFEAFCTRRGAPVNHATAGYFILAENVGPNTFRLRQTLLRWLVEVRKERESRQLWIATTTPGWRKRRRGTQGRPMRMPELRELLFAWFCDIRTIVKGRLPLACLKDQAKIFLRQLTLENKENPDFKPVIITSRRGARMQEKPVAPLFLRPSRAVPRGLPASLPANISRRSLKHPPPWPPGCRGPGP